MKKIRISLNFCDKKQKVNILKLKETYFQLTSIKIISISILNIQYFIIYLQSIRFDMAKKKNKEDDQEPVTNCDNPRSLKFQLLSSSSSPIATTTVF